MKDAAKILFLTFVNNKYHAIWSDYIAFSLCGEFRRQGVEATSLGYFDLTIPATSGVLDSRVQKLSSLASARARNLGSERLCSLRLRRFLASYRPDVVMTFFPRAGLKELVSSAGSKLAFWLVDAFEALTEDTARFAEQCDFVFTCFRNISSTLKGRSGSALWMPVTFDPSYFYPREVPRALPVVLVATYYPSREPALRDALYPLVKRLGRDVHIYGPGWTHNPNAQGGTIHGAVDWRDVSNIYSSAKVVLEVYDPNARKYGSLSTRTLESLACKSFLLTDYTDRELFTSGRDLVVCDSRDYADTALSFLDRDDDRVRIANAGHDRVLSSFGVGQRASELLRAMELA